ncbi:MAG: aldo/keto reductase family protein [Endozoicomonas sp.]
MDLELTVNSTRVPRFIYGTAWKEDYTRELVGKALASGFTGIDTANQRKHYFEAAVGQALQDAYGNSNLKREDIYLQTKFTFLPGQDERLPYEADASITEQVQQSFASSLEHLKTDYLDAYLLHGPMQREGLTDSDLEAWHAMEALYRSGQIKLLGVSNFSARQLEGLNHHAAIKPRLVQNRCFAVTGWDRDVRDVCQRHGIHYQGFSLLTANPAIAEQQAFQNMVTRTGMTPAQVIFQAALRMDMIVLTGTSSEQHMQEDLDCLVAELSDDEVRVIESLLVHDQE